MGYAIIENFSAGVDRSRPIYALPPGTLWAGINGHISRGGDFEQRKAFTPKYTLPEKTYSMASVGSELYVFGSFPTPGTMPAGVKYQRLAHPDGVEMSALLSLDMFSGKIYAAAQYTDGSVHHFYDGAIVTDWTDGVVRAAMVDNDGIAAHLKGLVDGKSWADSAQSTGTYSASVSGSIVTVAKGATLTSIGVGGFAENGAGNAVDDQSMSVGYTSLATSATFNVKGTFEANDRFGITLDGNKFGAEAMPNGKGTLVFTHQRKIYSSVGRIVNFSGLDTAIGWNRDEDPGAGFVDFSDQDGQAESIAAIQSYQNSLGLFARRVIQLWSMAADDANNAPLQLINNTGALSHEGTQPYGDIDTFYLSDTGLRSLRARDVNNTASVSDVGNPIDKYVVDYMATLTDAQIAAAVGVVDPTDGRFLMAIGTKVFVFSYFPAKKISAWTWYDLSFTISDFAVIGNRLYARAGDTIYLYGGDDNTDYDTDTVTCWLPFFSNKKHGSFKILEGFDMAAVGTWNVSILPNPDDLDQFIDVGSMTGFTFGDDFAGAHGRTTHMSIKLTKSSADPGSISMIGIYFEGADDE